MNGSTPQEAPKRLVQLKGAALSVFLALEHYGAQNCRALVEATGWWRGSVAEALEQLEALGLAQRLNYRAWALRQGVTAADLFPAPVEKPALLSTDGQAAVDNVDHGAALEGGRRQLSAGERRLAHVSAAEGSLVDLSAEAWPGDVSGPEASTADFSAEARLERVSEFEARREHASAAEARREQVSAEVGLEHVSEPEARRGRASAAEGSSAHFSAHDDVDVDELYKQLGYIKHHQHHAQYHDARARFERLVVELLALDPPFAQAHEWLRQTNLDLVEAWLAHLRGLDRDSRRAIRNQAAFVRAKVAAGAKPPPGKGAGAKPCARCGKGIFDRDKRCLVCAGVVRL